MLTPTEKILIHAKNKKYAVGAFNVYNMEGVLSVIESAEELKSPVILQILPSALAIGGVPLVSICCAAGRLASIPVSVHLDHCPMEETIKTALSAGVSSVMADGSDLPFETNLEFTRRMVAIALRFNAGVEGELGKITGIEDGFEKDRIHSKLTEPSQAQLFAEQTNVCALAVCIGNIHGTYPSVPDLDFNRLEKISNRVDIPLVLHGTSGLPEQMIYRAKSLGVCKFNVNTEVRQAYLNQIKTTFKSDESCLSKHPELIDFMRLSIDAMKSPIKEKMQLFGSINQV